jgi:ribonuclease D
MSGKQTTSDWSARPLTAAQLEYAAEDVLHLLRAEERVRQDLTSKGRLAWYEEEMAACLARWLAPEDTDFSEAHRRVKEWNSLSGRDLAVLRELAIWREQTARTKNLPRRAVLTDDSLIELARFQPDTLEKVQKLRRVNYPQVSRMFSELSAAIRRGKALERDQWPKKPVGERADLPTGLTELCQAQLRSIAEENGIAPTVISTAGDLQSFIAQRREVTTIDHPLLKGWRREVAGRKLIELLSGRIHVVVREDGSLDFRAVS